MIQHQGYWADHHVFVVPGIVDGDVAKHQATKKADKGEATVVHHHAKHVLGDNGEEIPTLVKCDTHYHESFGDARSPEVCPT